MLNFKREQYGSAVFSIEEIISDAVTGIVFEECISVKEVALFKSCIEHLKPGFYKDLNAGNGFSLPGMFGQLHKTQPHEVVQDYFDNISQFCQSANKACGFSIAEWLSTILNPYLLPYKLTVLPGFLPYSFRVVFPGKGGLFIHQDGKLLPYIHDSVSNIIAEKILPETMMSWFFSLQDPEEGGELWVADSNYSEYEKDGQYILISPKGVIFQAEDLIHQKIKTPTGSLLLFKGGSYWHKVLPPADGCAARITFGGFMARSREDNIIYYWS